MKKVSIIIPMYNAENTIEECLDSLTAQTIFAETELIIVDDHSTDGSREKVMSYEDRYPENIMLICLDSNAGPGNARNIAMGYASGEYIGFVDSDDAVYPAMFGKMHDEALRTGADIVDSGFYDQKNDKAILYVSDELSGELDDKKRSSLIVVGGFICTKIFKREFLESAGMKFRQEYVLEDMDFLIGCIARAGIISNVKEMMYIYRDTGASLSKTVDTMRYIHNQSSAMKAIYDRTHLLPNYAGIKDAAEFTMLHLYSNILNTCMNAVYLKQQPKDMIIPMLSAMKKLKDCTVTGGYDTEYVRKGISDDNMRIIKANDVSPERVLGLLR